MGWLVGLFLLIVLGLPPSALAQPETTETPKFYLNKNDISLPIMLDPRVAKSTREVRLFVKKSADDSWRLYTRTNPSQKAFSFHAPNDGEYWFAVSTVDLSGRSNVSDPTKLKAGAIVVLDSQPPAVSLKRLGDSPEGVSIQCRISDTHPDPLKTKFYYQTQDRRWRLLDPKRSSPDTYCIPSQAVLTGMVRVDAVDRCNNTARIQTHLQDLQQNPNPNPKLAQRSSTPEPASPADQDTLRGQVPAPPQLLKGFPSNTQNVTSPPKNANSETQKRAQVEQPKFSSSQPDPVIQGQPPTKSPEDTTRFPTKATEPVTTTEGVRRIVAQRVANATEPHLTNNRNVEIRYVLQDAGAGLQKVEIWVTKDFGRTWNLLGVDADKRSPAQVVLPGEGRYGFQLVVYNSVGRGGTTPPQPGDVPQRIVQLDTTPPDASITSVTPIQSSQPGLMLISWKARDENLGKRPIALFYAEQPTGPWIPLAKDLPNVGYHTWKMPQSTAKRVYVRMVVVDQAGNVKDHQTSKAVELDDGTRPTAQIIDIAPLNKR
ncbi:MAG: hypothetical protein ACFCD0_13940 [Gemmataceae bacterium]